MDRDERFERWLDAIIARHTVALRRPEFLKAIRALSVRYVEARATLHSRSPLDSAGKRAAFSAFYAPLHYLTTREVVLALGLERRNLLHIFDLGCGTGAAGTAWAAALSSAELQLHGVDASRWALEEARWTWRTFGIRGRAQSSDLVRAAERLAATRRSHPSAVLLGWAVNELEPVARERLLRPLLDLAQQRASVLIIEPIARSFQSWWDEWAAAFRAIGGTAAEWRFPVELPKPLAALDEEAGFSRGALTARTLVAGH